MLGTGKQCLVYCYTVSDCASRVCHFGRRPVMCSYSGLLLLVARMLGNLNPIRLLSFWLKFSVTEEELLWLQASVMGEATHG